MGIYMKVLKDKNEDIQDGNELQYKKWNIVLIGTLFTVMTLIAVLVFVVDPYWHFHGPLESFSYRLGNGRYMNNGISRNTDYDTIIIGTSMTENFKTSLWDELTGANSIKIPFFGATFREIHNNLERAFLYNDHIETVIWGVDYNQLTVPYDFFKYENYPEYLYNDSIWDDGDYVWNKTVLLRGVLPAFAYTVLGKETTSYDAYNSWEEESGVEAVLADYTKTEIPREHIQMDEKIQSQIIENVYENMETIILTHPDTRFYLFFTPYSIAYWDALYYGSEYDIQIEATRIFVNQLLKYDNVYLFGFFDNYDMICDPNNYVDSGHYIGEINDRMMEWMVSGEYQFTNDNYKERIDSWDRFYSEFDYLSFWEDLIAMNH